MISPFELLHFLGSWISLGGGVGPFNSTVPWILKSVFDFNFSIGALLVIRVEFKSGVVPWFFTLEASGFLVPFDGSSFEDGAGLKPSHLQIL